MNDFVIDSGQDWTIPGLYEMAHIVEGIGTDMGYSIYKNQMEIISAEQMLDAYSSIGMPLMYKHWSFGKQFLKDQEDYNNGRRGLAYEIVINSDPCLVYCVDHETEYLTPTGWKKISEYENGPIAQYNKDGTIEFVEPQAYIKQPYDGEFVYINMRGINQKLTPNHRVVYLDTVDRLKEVPASDLMERHNKLKHGFNGRIVTTFKNTTGEGLALSDDEIRLHVAYKADGTSGKRTTRLQFMFHRQRKIDRLRELLTRMEIPYTEGTSTVRNRTHIYFDIGYIPEKRFTSEWWSVNEHQQQIISEELLYWDGSSIGNGSWSGQYKEDVDFVQFIWASQGFTTSIGHDRIWYIRRSKQRRSLTSDPYKNRIETVKSDHKFFYCFTVPSSMLLLRRENKIFVTGNCMEQNDYLMQAIVFAHAGVGHNHFFKNNYMFKDWTDAGSIIDYLEYAKTFMAECEEKYGVHEVETILNYAHSLQSQGVFRYPRKEPLSLKRQKDKETSRALQAEQDYNDLWRTLPKSSPKTTAGEELDKRRKRLNLPEENLLFFLEKNSPILRAWQREALRIVRNIAQYFYPQGQTKVMNEGCATFTDYKIMNEMYDRGMITPGGMISYLKDHSGIILQPGMEDKRFRYNGINPYAIGFAMMQDIVRVCEDPTSEDFEWFPNMAGKGKSMDVLFDAWENYRDESFIRQFLSPKVMRDFRFISIQDNDQYNYKVQSIHNDEGYRQIREAYGNSIEITNTVPEINVVDVDLQGDRQLKLEFRTTGGGKQLYKSDAIKVVKNIAELWGYSVMLTMIDSKTGNNYDRIEASPTKRTTPEVLDEVSF